MKSTSFPHYFSENIISVGKIPAFLHAFKVSHIKNMAMLIKKSIFLKKLQDLRHLNTC